MQNCLNFAKKLHLKLSGGHQNSIIKEFHSMIKKSFLFEAYRYLKLELRVFLAGHCCYGNLFGHENYTNIVHQ